MYPIFRLINGSTRMWASEYLLYDGLGQHLATNIPRGNVTLPEFRITDYLGNTRLVLGPGATLRDTFSYTPFGKVWSSNAMVEGKPRLSFFGKEIDRESGLGDYGARKYEPSYGRFTSVDPHWEKYRPLSPYNYSNNNPITAIDADGRDIVGLNKSKGAMGFGHTAILIGNDVDGWWFYTKSGKEDNPGGKDGPDDDDGKGARGGMQDKEAARAKGYFFKNLADFEKAAKGEDVGIKNKQIARDLTEYDGAFRISTTPEQDAQAHQIAQREESSDYNFVFSNCDDISSKVLTGIGLERNGGILNLFGVLPLTGHLRLYLNLPYDDPNDNYERYHETYKGIDVSSKLFPNK